MGFASSDHLKLSSASKTSTSYNDLKKLAGYSSDPKTDFKIGFFSSKSISLEQDKIIVAPYGFLERLIAWIIPNPNPATGKDYHQRDKLKREIQQHLSETGIGDPVAKHIVEQVVGNSIVTRRDLRRMIAMTEQKLEIGNFLSMLQTSADSPQQQAEKLIQRSRLFLQEIAFDPNRVDKLRRDVERLKENIQSLLSDSALPSAMDQMEKKIECRLIDQNQKEVTSETRTQLQEQRDRLFVREKMLSQYLQRNPFNDKNVLYPRRIYAEAAKLLFDGKLSSVKDASKIESLKNKFDTWYETEVDSYNKANPNKRSHPTKFYLDKNNRDNPLLKYNAKYVMNVLNSLFSKEGLAFDQISEKEVKEAAKIAMNESPSLPWQKVERDMIFSVGGKTGIYYSRSTPLSKTETAVGAELRNQEIGGIIPAVRDDGRAPINARMTQLFKVEYVFNSETDKSEEKKILLHERQQHGINDHFAIKDPEKRSEANIASMRQLIQSGAEADPDFIGDAISNPQEQHNVFYINTNLTTPTWTPRGPTNDEYTYSMNQGAAMKELEGSREFSVLDPNNKDIREIKVNVKCIDFRFPVNYAISDLSEDKRAADPGMLLGAWSSLKTHNEGELKKLFGDLGVDDPIGGVMQETYQKLTAEFYNDPEAKQLKDEIDQQIGYIRSMFQSSSYQRAGDDRFKMPRHIDLLVNAFRRASELVDDHKVRVVNAGGCKSGKDREGTANAENEAAIIIQDLGGQVKPNQGGRYNNEVQAIYDSCMTGVVDNTQQVTGIGGSKNAKEIANQMSDPDAIIYAQGGSKFVEA